MSRITVVFPPLRVSRDFIDYPYFADLGAVSAAATLRAAGHDVTLVDALAMPSSGLAAMDAGYVRLGAPVADVLAALPPAELTLVAYTPFHRPPARDVLLAEVLAGAASRGPVALADLYQSGQHYVESADADVLASYPEASGFLRYEAEDALAGFVAALLAPAPGDAPIVQRGREPKDLDALPMPAWDLVDLDAYHAFHERVVAGLGRPAWAFPIDGRSAPVVTSRGCPFRCIHCSSNPGRAEGAPKTQRRHGLAWLDRLLGDLAARGVRRVHVLDELANVSERHFDGLLDLLEKHGLAFEIPNGLRADYVTDAHLARMKGRLSTLSVSAESGSARVVAEVVDKQLDLGAIERVAASASAAGVPLLIHFLIGMPGETAAEINETLAFALRLHEEHGAWPAVQHATPLPGTRLAALATEGGKRALPVVADWGPYFQGKPTVETSEVSLSALRRFKWTFDQRIEAAQGPKKVIMNVTYRCNNRCTFCATGTRTQFDGDYDKQIELLTKYRQHGVELLDFDGGEPTLNPNLFRLVRAARMLGYRKVNVTTNGRMAAYGDYAARLAGSGITSLLFSIHGPDAQTHAQNVGVAEAFDQTCEGVRNVVALGRRDVALGANVTVTKSNHRKLMELAELVESLGLRWFNIQFLTPFGRATSSVCPDTDVAAREVMAVIDRFHERMKIQVINLPFCFMPGYERHLMGDMLKLERHMLFVNNDEVNLFSYLRDRRVKKDVCTTCPHAIFCGGFYELEDVPEPTWLIKPEDLVRGIDRDVPRATG